MHLITSEVLRLGILSFYVLSSTGDYDSVFSLVTNTELQPVKTLMSHALVCVSNKTRGIHHLQRRKEDIKPKSYPEKPFEI